MDDQNPYRASESAIVDASEVIVLAGLGERLAAAILDIVFVLAILYPAMYFSGYFKVILEAAAGGLKPPFSMLLLWGIIGFAVFITVQGFPLHMSGQTWGKRILGIRIVGMDGQKPSLIRLLILRYFPIRAISLIPIAKVVFPLINVLLIFRSDRRCGHDLIAGTRVIKTR